MHDLLHAWPILLPLAAILATCVLGTLTRHQGHAQDAHDLVRQTRQNRLHYIASVQARMANPRATPPPDGPAA